ncbi:phage baseplate protein [Absicoccus porci]|uniref:phage baseplate protein n=1 Tax=Absicoccus porci TaxID=2486576 RepID=UPI003F88C9F0
MRYFQRFHRPLLSQIHLLATYKFLLSIKKCGGEYSHRLTVNEMPSHNHSPSSTGRVQIANLGGGSYVVADLSNKGNVNWAYKTASTGGNQAHSLMNPYIVTFFWRRIA